MKKILALASLLAACAAVTPTASLYDQSVAQALAARFTSPAVSYLLVDARTGATVAARWPELGRPVLPGSLVKPFVALAYADSHGYSYPEFTCRGAADGCWLPRGHGRIGMTQAVEYSCNAYFLKLATQVSREDIELVRRQFGFPSQPASLSAPELIGLGRGMELPPKEIARAYIELAGRPADPGVAQILAGMALSARAGTAMAIQKSLRGAPVLAKTGTAPCIHSPRAPGDGYTIILYPADAPRIALLVRVHGVPGAHAAEIGGEMLRTLVTGQ
jgi:cell division protein FtsI/penicillin-binding protein 2